MIKTHQIILPEGEKTNYLVIYPGCDRPLLPRGKAPFNFDMQESVCKRLRHLVCHRFICGTVTRCDHNAVIGQSVLSDNAVKGYLIRRRLNRLRCGRYLIKEEDIYNIIARIHLKDLRLQPNGKRLIRVGGWDSA